MQWTTSTFVHNVWTQTLVDGCAAQEGDNQLLCPEFEGSLTNIPVSFIPICVISRVRATMDTYQCTGTCLTLARNLSTPVSNHLRAHMHLCISICMNYRYFSELRIVRRTLVHTLIHTYIHTSHHPACVRTYDCTYIHSPQIHA
jgi:hypothetical protein